MAKAATVAPQAEPITITAPNLKTIRIRFVGTAPYVQNRFSQKAMLEILASHTDPTKKNTRKREPKDVDALYNGAMHKDENGKFGIPAAAFRNAMIDACRVAGYKMTMSKMSVFVEADGYDAIDGTALVHIEGKPEQTQIITRNDNGSPDVRIRPMWRKWAGTVRITYDADQFRENDVANLLLRAGRQVGVGEGRPYSKNSAGMGWGMFTLEDN